jgi:drug/metabolite transporter (DMT)-like permease
MPAPEHGAGGGLLAGLLRRGWWWAGTAASVAGLGLQLLALSFGSIIVVQTVLTSSIVWTTLIEWGLLGRRPASRAWLGIILTGAGLLTVLLSLAPTTGAPGQAPSAAVTIGLAGLCAVVMGTAVAYARRVAARGRALGLAVATGVGYGVTAVALKTVSAQFTASGLGVLAHPGFWTAVILGPLSVLLSQHALRAGRAVIAVVAVILVVDPLVGLVAGTLWFGEHIATAPIAVTAAIAGGLGLVTGIATIQGGGRSARALRDRTDHAGDPARRLLHRPRHVRAR